MVTIAYLHIFSCIRYFNKYFLNSKSSNDNIKNLINMLTIFNWKLLLGTYYISIFKISSQQQYKRHNIFILILQIRKMNIKKEK